MTTTLETIIVPCPDQGDPNCHEEVEIFVAEDATPAQRDAAIEMAPSCPACGTDQLTSPVR
ncbi:MAG: hypothetical protein AB7I35_12905 [Ramlibacter sp.]